MPRLFCLIAALFAAAHAAAVEVVSARPEAVEVVIYRDSPLDTADLYAESGGNDGLAMITETRTVGLPAGTSTLKFVGTADGMVPQTAKLEALPAHLLESNFNYDLISPGAIIARSLGAPVHLIRTDPATGKVSDQPARLVSGPDGVLLDIDGRIEALGCSGLPERLVFDTIPGPLADKPTLSVTVTAQQAGIYQVRLSYLVIGLTWSADYVAHLHSDGKTLDLHGWVTLANNLATTFRQAPVHVVAGNLYRDEEKTVPPPNITPRLSERCWPRGMFGNSGFTSVETGIPPAQIRQARSMLEEVIVTAQKRAVLSELGDYKLYTLPERTTVAAHQIKQVLLMEQPAVHYDPVYTVLLDPGRWPRPRQLLPATRVLRLTNDAGHGLGVPLPLGSVAVFAPGAGTSPVLAGRDHLDDVPLGGDTEIGLDATAQVWAEARVVEDSAVQQAGVRRRRASVEVRIGNDRPQAVTLELYRDDDTSADILSESKRHDFHRGRARWRFHLEPGGRDLLRYTVEARD